MLPRLKKVLRKLDIKIVEALSISSSASKFTGGVYKDVTISSNIRELMRSVYEYDSTTLASINQSRVSANKGMFLKTYRSLKRVIKPVAKKSFSLLRKLKGRAL